MYIAKKFATLREAIHCSENEKQNVKKAFHRIIRIFKFISITDCLLLWCNISTKKHNVMVLCHGHYRYGPYVTFEGRQRTCGKTSL